MAWLQKRNGIYYICQWEGKKKIKKSLKTGDDDVAKKTLEIYQHKETQHVKEDTIIELFKTNDKDLEIHRCLIKDIWKTYQAQPQPRRLKERTIAQKKIVVNCFIQWVNNNLPYLKYVDELTEKNASEYIVSLGIRAGRTKLNHLSCLSSVFALLVIPYNLPKNVWKSVVRTEAVSVRRKNLTLDQIFTIWEISKTFKSRVENFWPFAIPFEFYTGVRVGDTGTLDWSEINMKTERITLLPEKTWRKGNEVTYVIREEYGFYLKKLYKGQKKGPVWPEVVSALKVNHNWISNEFAAICHIAKIKTSRLPKKGEGVKRVVLVGQHSLRHSNVTEALNMGHSKDDVKKSVGHGSPMMTDRYDHSQGAGIRISSSLPKLKKRK